MCSLGSGIARFVVLKGLLWLLCREKIGEWPECKEATTRLLKSLGKPWLGRHKGRREVEGKVFLEFESSGFGGGLDVWSRKGRTLG